MKATKKRRSLCCAAVVAAIVLIGLLFLILGLTVFKPKHPTTVVNSTSISDLRFSIDPFPSLGVRLNMTLHVNVTVDNPNSVGFKYSDSTAYLRYRGTEVGSAPIPAGKIGGKSEEKMNLALTLMLDRLLGDSNLYSDVISGSVPLQTVIRVRGKVKILFSVKVATHTTCDLVVGLSSRNVESQNCRYSTKVG